MKHKRFHLLLLCIFTILIYQVTLHAATIVLRSGAAVKGKLIDRNDDEITLQDAETRQLRKIKTIFVKDIVLDPGEEKIGMKKKRDTARDLKPQGGDEKPSDFLSALDPTLGILPGVAVPFGDVSKAVNIGYGGTLFCDLALPVNIDILKIRPGLSVGFLYHTTKGGSSFSFSKKSAYVMMLPINAYFKFQFIAPYGLRPYIKVGGGITPVLAQGDSSFDPTIAPGIGLGYVNEKIPYLEFYIEAGVLMAFEKVRGDFITASLGLSYRFGAPPPGSAKK